MDYYISDDSGSGPIHGPYPTLERARRKAIEVMIGDTNRCYVYKTRQLKHVGVVIRIRTPYSEKGTYTYSYSTLSNNFGYDRRSSYYLNKDGTRKAMSKAEKDYRKRQEKLAKHNW